MEYLLEWAWQIICCLIFITVLSNLLPKTGYEKYIRLFSGMVLILLILKPVTESLDLDDKIAALFQNIQFQEEAGEFRRQLSQMEQNRFDKMTEEYEKQVEEEVTQMVQAAGLQAENAEVRIETNPESSSYGGVCRITMEIEGKREETFLVSPVEPIKIGGAPEEGQPASAVPEKVDLEKSEALKRRISEYYGVEEQNVEIYWKD